MHALNCFRAFSFLSTRASSTTRQRKAVLVLTCSAVNAREYSDFLLVLMALCCFFAGGLVLPFCSKLVS